MASLKVRNVQNGHAMHLDKTVDDERFQKFELKLSEDARRLSRVEGALMHYTSKIEDIYRMTHNMAQHTHQLPGDLESEVSTLHSNESTDDMHFKREQTADPQRLDVSAGQASLAAVLLQEKKRAHRNRFKRTALHEVGIN